MSTQENTKATQAFSAQSSVFDAIYKPSPIVQYKRKRVRELLQKHLQKNSTILELNAGTGEDALWLAEQGHTVLATDASAGMIAQQKKKFASLNVEGKLTSRQLSFLNSNELTGQKFDAIFSNFGGLNCTNQLDKVLTDASKLLKPNGIICLTIMPPNCLWEWLSALKGNFNLAFRRWKKGGTKAHIEGEFFTTYYYKPSFVKKHLPGFKHIKTEALCLAVPPEYLRKYAERYPRVFSLMVKMEIVIKSWPVLRNWGDYFVIVMRVN